MIKESPKIIVDGQEVVVNSKFEPSAFFNYVLLPCFRENDKKDKMLFLHEVVHAKKLHSVDLILYQLIRIGFWFHPLLHLIEGSLREIHEYQADKMVVLENNKKEYAQLLLQLVRSNCESHLSNNFNQFQTKKRILMMNRKTSEKWQKVRFLLSIPLLSLMLFVFSCENTNQDEFPESMDNAVSEIVTPPSDGENARIAGPDEIYDLVEDLPSYPGGMEAWNQYLSQNLKYPAQARRMGIEGTTYVAFVVKTDGSIQDVEMIRGIGGGCDAEAMRVISQSQKWNPGKQRGQNVNVRVRLPIKFKLE